MHLPMHVISHPHTLYPYQHTTTHIPYQSHTMSCIETDPIPCRALKRLLPSHPHCPPSLPTSTFTPPHLHLMHYACVRVEEPKDPERSNLLRPCRRHGGVPRASSESGERPTLCVPRFICPWDAGERERERERERDDTFTLKP